MYKGVCRPYLEGKMGKSPLPVEEGGYKNGLENEWYGRNFKNFRLSVVGTAGSQDFGNKQKFTEYNNSVFITYTTSV